MSQKIAKVYTVGKNIGYTACCRELLPRTVHRGPQCYLLYTCPYSPFQIYLIRRNPVIYSDYNYSYFKKSNFVFLWSILMLIFSFEDRAFMYQRCVSLYITSAFPDTFFMHLFKDEVKYLRNIMPRKTFCRCSARSNTEHVIVVFWWP